jgi:hypothetical protein
VIVMQRVHVNEHWVRRYTEVPPTFDGCLLVQSWDTDGSRGSFQCVWQHGPQLSLLRPKMVEVSCILRAASCGSGRSSGYPNPRTARAAGWPIASTGRRRRSGLGLTNAADGIPESAAFKMGFALGATTALRNAGQADTEQNRQARSAQASVLGVPAPEMPPLQSPSYALRGFRAHVAGDPQCIGALLAKLYSPRAN